MNNIESRENSISEIEAIYKIVFRNIQPHNYTQLFPDAQEVILREAEALLLYSNLSTYKKQLLFNSLKSLQIENYQILHKIAHEFQTEKSNPHSIEAYQLRSIITMGDSENRAVGDRSGNKRS